MSTTIVAIGRRGAEDGYAATVEYLELFSRPLWAEVRPAVERALAAAESAAGLVLDLGAGTGIGTEIVLDAAPGARVLAVEPSPALRAVLLAKLARDPGHAQRVTVQPRDAAGMELPDRLGGALAMHMIGHLTPAARRVLWRDVAHRLAPGAPLVVGLQPPDQAVAVPLTRVGETAVGDHRYECWACAEPTSATTLRWTMTYRTLHEGRVLDERTAAHDWQIASVPAVTTELAASGLTAEATPGGLVVARRPRP
jgi:SAM-dependent methyltransferase